MPHSRLMSVFFFFFREFVERSGAQLTTIPDAIFDSDIVIVAVPKDFYKVSKKVGTYLIKGQLCQTFLP
jgi:hypothetical protein